MSTTNGYLDGIFSSCTAPTPDAVRLWLQVARTAVGWSQEAAAKQADVDLKDVARLERTGEAEDEDDDAILDALASAYRDAMYARPEAQTIAYRLDSFGQVFTHDGNFQLARFLRRRRAEMGLTLEQVAERTGGRISAKGLHDAEWEGSRALTNWGEQLRAIAKGLDVPYFELRRLAEYIDEEDVEEWITWRAASSTKPRRTRRL